MAPAAAAGAATIALHKTVALQRNLVQQRTLVQQRPVVMQRGSMFAMRYTLQAATYGSEEFARQDALLLKAKKYQSFLIKSGKYWLLCVGNFNNKERAAVLLKKLPGEYRLSQVRRF